MKTLPLLSLLLISVGSALQITLNSEEEFGIDHKTGTFGRQNYDLTASMHVIPQGNGDEFMCNTDGSRSGAWLDAIVVASRGGCTFAEKARNAQKAGAAALVIGDNFPTSTVYVWMMCDEDCATITIPVVFIPGTGYQRLAEAVRRQDSLSVMGGLTTESSWIAPPVNGPPGGDTGGFTPPTDTGGFTPPTDVEYPVDNTSEESAWMGMTIVWVIVGLSVMLKCLIITVACRRKYRSKRLAQRAGSANVPLTEGEMAEGDLPVVYATHPAPSSAFSVSSASSERARPLSASSLAAYPSLQYAPLLPATAPDVYDLERQPIIIRG